MLRDNIPKIRSGGWVEEWKNWLLSNPSEVCFSLLGRVHLSAPSNCSYGSPLHSLANSFRICQWWSGCRSTFYSTSNQSCCCFKTQVGCCVLLLTGEASLCIQWKQAGIQVVNHSWELLDPQECRELNLFCATPFTPSQQNVFKCIKTYLEIPRKLHCNIVTENENICDTVT